MLFIIGKNAQILYAYSFVHFEIRERNDISMDNLEKVLEYMPTSISQLFAPKKSDLTCAVAPKKSDLTCAEEIRLRTNKPLAVKTEKGIELFEHIVTQQEVLQTFERICESSVYSYRKQICDGYITIRGGNRVGIVGSAVIDNGQVINIYYISSLNFRIASQRIGCSNRVIEDIINVKQNEVYNTLIVSPPGCGKTTLLRDIVRNISNGIKVIGFEGKNVGIADERGEIAAMYKGIPQNDVGIRTDVIDNMPKSMAMRILVRSMAPNVIACDEIGSSEDIYAIEYAMCSGVKGIFTAHGKDIEEINRNPELSRLLNRHIFERIILLNPKKKGETECFYL